MARHSKWARRLAVLAAFIVLVTIVAGKSRADDKLAPAAKTRVGFDHLAHAMRFDMKACASCHANSEADRPPPTTRGHAPCMTSGCHIDQFLSTGPRTKKDDLPTYKAAASFCATCHKSADGSPPNRFAKAKADALFENKLGANYHVEMNHQQHSERTACSTCHKVDATTFKLVAGGPSHAQCATCHKDSDEPMTACASCHETPGPSEYFTATRKATDVRVCNTETEDGRPCFRHERTEHRFLPDQSQLECSSCHFMFKQKKHQGMSYESLKDVKAAPIMNNKRDLAHQSCGVGGCHKRDVDDSMGTARCTQCHSAKFMANSLAN